MHKKLNGFCKQFVEFIYVDGKTKKGRSKRNIQKQCWDIFNELYYIYKEKYNEEKDGLNWKNKKEFDYTNLRLANDYSYESEDEESKMDEETNYWGS